MGLELRGLGPYDYLDVFGAPGPEVATQVSAIVRTFCHATTETRQAITWDRFKELAKGL